MPSIPLRLAVLLSGAGTTLQNLIDEIAADRLDATINIVIGSRPKLRGLEGAADAKLPNFVVDRTQSDADFSRKIFSLIDDAGVDLVLFAGWLCLLEIPEKYAAKVMNIHPSLLPSFGGKGMYGRKVHQAVLDHGCKITGCTVHFVDSTYDNGPIILQRPCPVLENDTAEILASRVFAEEKIAYPQAIQMFHENKLTVDGRRVIVSS